MAISTLQNVKNLPPFSSTVPKQMQLRLQYFSAAVRFAGDSTLFSAVSLSRCIEIGHRQSRPVNECSEEKREG